MATRETPNSSPQLLARELRPRHQRFEFGPHDRGVNPAIERPLRKAAIGARNYVFTADGLGKTYDTLCNKLRMFHHIGGMADDAWNERLAGGQFHILPDLPFVLVSRIGALDHIGADVDAQDEIDNVA